MNICEGNVPYLRQRVRAAMDDIAFLRVLVADHEPQVTEVFREVVRTWSMPADLKIIDDPATAAAEMGKKPYDIAFLDVDVTGALYAIERSKLNETAASIVALTVRDDLSIQATLARANIPDRIVKPVTPPSVLRVLRTLERILVARRVLVVDPAPATARVIRRVLSDSRFRLLIDVEDNAVDALLAHTAKPYDVVLYDLATPGDKPGLVLERLKSLDPRRHVFVVSSEPAKVVFRHAPMNRIDGFLPKPFKVRQFDQMLRRLYGLGQSDLAPAA